MEHVEAMSEGEWNNFSGMYSSSSTIEEANFMAQLLGNGSLPSGCNLAAAASTSSTAKFSWPIHDSNMDMVASINGMNEPSMFSNPNEGENHNLSTNMYYYFSQGSNSSGTSSGSLLPSLYNEGGYCHPTTSMSMMDYFVLEPKTPNHYLMGVGGDDLTQDVSNEDIIMDYSNENKQIIDNFGLHGMVDLQLGREHDMVDVPKSSSHDELSSDLAKKRPRTLVVNKNKRIVKPKKNPKLASSIDDEGENNKAIFQRQDSMLSRTSIEVDSNASQDLNGGATSSSCPRGDGVLNLSGKARASRGAATDPQSLYARKRRERINERLKILQNLVPNGTKVDISTMLEEAVQYVKFLQLQIKLLSSDDMWMYSPIAYNGMDIGLLPNVDASTA